MDAESKSNEPRLKRQKSGYMVDIMIPPECMDDEGDCEHTKKPVRHEQNPV